MATGKTVIETIFTITKWNQLKITIMKKLLTIIIILFAFASCNNYYKAVTANQPVPTSIVETMKMKDKYFILRDDLKAFAMKNILITEDKKNIQCTLETLPAMHKLHLTNGRDGDMKYRTTKITDDDETLVLNEVHVYIIPGNNSDTGSFTISIANIEKIEILEKDKQKTKRSHAVGTAVAIGVSVIAVAGIAAAAFSSPFIIF